MKRIWMSAVSLAALLFLLCACGGEEGQGENTDSGGGETAEQTTQTGILLDGAIVVTEAPYGAAGDGSADDAPAFLKAIAAAGEEAAILFLPDGNYHLAESLEIPANITLYFDRNAMITTAEGVTVTLNGAVKAPIRQIFSGEGRIKGRSPSVGYPQYFSAGEAERDESRAVQCAVDVFASVRLMKTAGSFRFGEIRIEKPTVIEGAGRVRTEIERLSGKNLFIIASDGVTVRNLNITGNGEGNRDDAVFFFDTSSDDLSDIRIENIYRACPFQPAARCPVTFPGHGGGPAPTGS